MKTHSKTWWRRASCAWLALAAALAACAADPEHDDSTQAAVAIDPLDDPDDPVGPVIAAPACAAPTLALDAANDRFTIDGQQTFLQCVSYFGALGLSDASMTADFAELKARGFNCVRVWPNWGYPKISPENFYAGKSVMMPTLVPSATVNSINLGRLKRLIEIAAEHYFVVDVTFTRDTVRHRGCMPYSVYKAGILQITNALKPYRNAFFDLQNETDHYDNPTACDSTADFPLCSGDPDEPSNPVNRTCNIAYLSPARWADLSAAVHAADAGRVVTASGMDASFQPPPDAVMVHCCRGASWPAGIDDAIVAAAATFPNRPVHAQEPNRCRRFADDGSNLVNCAAPAELNPATNSFVIAGGLVGGVGGDGFTLHTAASFDLSSTRLNPRLNAAEVVARDNLATRVPPRGAVPPRPVLLSPPPDAIVGTRPVLKWQAVIAYPPVSQYALKIRRVLPDGTLRLVDSPLTCDTHYTPPAGTLQVGETYQWSVRAQNDLGWSANAKRRFSVQ